MFTPSILIVIMLLVAYLSGSISSAVIVCRLAGLQDPREEGSKNPGASNVLRLAGKKYALIVVVADMLKGLLPVLIAGLLPIPELALGYIALAAVLGHMFPIFFSFNGGKGVATAIGALFGLQFILGFLVAVTWLAIAKTSRYASFASLISMLLMPFYSLYTIGNIAFISPLFFITIFIFYKHRENINRLIDGSETKLSFFKPIITSSDTKKTDTTNIETETSETTESEPTTSQTTAPKKTKTVKTGTTKSKTTTSRTTKPKPAKSKASKSKEGKKTE